MALSDALGKWRTSGNGFSQQSPPLVSDSTRLSHPDGDSSFSHSLQISSYSPVPLPEWLKHPIMKCVNLYVGHATNISECHLYDWPWMVLLLAKDIIYSWLLSSWTDQILWMSISCKPIHQVKTLLAYVTGKSIVNWWSTCAMSVVTRQWWRYQLFTGCHYPRRLITSKNFWVQYAWPAQQLEYNTIVPSLVQKKPLNWLYSFNNNRWMLQ